MQFKKGRPRAGKTMSVLLNAPLIDPKGLSSVRGVRQVLREMSPAQKTSLSPAEYLIFSGKGPFFFVDPTLGNSDENPVSQTEPPDTR